MHEGACRLYQSTGYACYNLFYLAQMLLSVKRFCLIVLYVFSYGASVFELRETNLAASPPEVDRRLNIFNPVSFILVRARLSRLQDLTH